ncbi:hypothetical protein HYQ44_008135 [Verticillium longisporum]|nr:hypothetical protein HYQ44_008135 [Verticillium longisporum]
MAIQTEQLVTRPFSEIIERGNEAIAQAEDVADEDEDVSWRMLKAGQALVKEGERAMKRLAPMVKDQTPEFGDALKDLMTRDGEVKEKQRALDGMLYDFEDYIEVDSFDEAKFKELQAAAKSLALTIMEATRDARVPSLPERENKSILIEEWASSDRSTIPDTTSTIGNPSWKVVDLVIGPDSSFYERKGFCKGAKTFRESGPGDAVKKVGGAGDVPKPTPYTQDILYGQMFNAPPPVFADAKAQCMHCEYEHKYSQLLQDTDKESIADLQGEGIRYRRRFLYKSHMATRHMTKTSYGCPFCVHIGSTTYEGDATVFQSAALLLRHLARHPQPLPDVPGLTVLYGTITGEPNEHDFDIHFPNPAAPPGGPPDGGASLPSAVATRDHVQMPDEKPLARPEPGTEVLQFFAGARIIGVEFPERWGGKWCLGWHDGIFGAFQARWVQLEAPRRGKLAGQAPPRTQRSGIARWKWDVKAGTGPGWLGFDKGETITNLDWDDPDAWYWVGTTSKGKHGIFPTSHMKIETIKDGSLEGLTSPVKPKKRGFFGLGRRNSSAAPSEHGSGHSHKS